MKNGHPRDVDPVTGYDTTGHDWNGIRELNTPFPRFVAWILAITVAYSVVAWVLLPAWPTGRDYTRGLLGLDQAEVAESGQRELAAVRESWLASFEHADFAAIETDRALVETALPAAARLFRDNCAACHGQDGAGGPGFPVLRDDTWLWGGDPETVAETIRVGINTAHPDTRVAEMPPFDWLGRADRESLAAYVAGLPADGPAAGSGAALFEENCIACHGEGGEGGLGVGAPSLRDAATLYGQDTETVLRTLLRGRRGVMPAWSDRLSAAEINLLALYVTRLGSGAEEAAR
jgi:cytochrome c oxidase cbb3-type subunit 3